MDEPRFGRFEVRNFQGFVPIPNGKFTHFLIFYEVRTFGSVQGSIFFWNDQSFKVQFQSTNPGSEDSRFSFLKVQEVRGSVFSGSFQV